MTSIDWTRLHHAYGPAADIPALLARARTAPPPADYTDEPWYTLWSSLYHQDDVFSASYAAVPELVILAAERGGEVAAESLFLAASVELRRNEPGAPDIPPAIQGPYEHALKAARDLVSRLLVRDADPHGKLAVAAAVLRGDFAAARALLDPDENNNGE